jgi:hypothetical protein
MMRGLDMEEAEMVVVDDMRSGVEWRAGRREKGEREMVVEAVMMAVVEPGSALVTVAAVRCELRLFRGACPACTCLLPL